MRDATLTSRAEPLVDPSKAGRKTHNPICAYGIRKTREQGSRSACGAQSAVLKVHGRRSVESIAAWHCSPLPTTIF